MEHLLLLLAIILIIGLLLVLNYHRVITFNFVPVVKTTANLNITFTYIEDEQSVSTPPYNCTKEFRLPVTPEPGLHIQDDWLHDCLKVKGVSVVGSGLKLICEDKTVDVGDDKEATVSISKMKAAGWTLVPVPQPN